MSHPAQRKRPDSISRASENAIAGFSATVEWAGAARCAVVLTGEVDMHTAPILESELLGAIEAGAQGVTVDLTEATFIDSTFLGVLTAAHKRLDEVGGGISIVCANPNLTKIFEITGLDNMFAINATRHGLI